MWRIWRHLWPNILVGLSKLNRIRGLSKLNRIRSIWQVPDSAARNRPTGNEYRRFSTVFVIFVVFGLSFFNGLLLFLVFVFCSVVLSCVVLCCLVLYWLVLCLPCTIFFCVILSCRVLSCLLFSCAALSCLVVSCLVLTFSWLCLVLSCLAPSCLVLSCFRRPTWRPLRPLHWHRLCLRWVKTRRRLHTFPRWRQALIWCLKALVGFSPKPGPHFGKVRPKANVAAAVHSSC